MAGGAGVSMIGSYLLVNLLPFDSYMIAIKPGEILILLSHYAALATPFFFCGLIISLMLRIYPGSGNKVYAMNLLGSAAGCLVAVLLPRWVGSEGMVLLSAAIAALSGFFYMFGKRTPETEGRRPKAGLWGFLTLTLAFSLLMLFLAGYGEGFDFFRLKLSQYKGLSYALQSPDARIASTERNSYSRVDVVHSSSLHSVPGLSYRYTGPLPEIVGLFVDGDNMNAIFPYNADMGFASYLPASAAFELRPGARVLILNSKGGMDVMAALASGASKVTAVENNQLVVDAARHVYDPPDVKLVVASGRSFLRQDQERYDIIQLPLVDSYHPVGSGAYSLGEDYRYTVQAVRDMLSQLNAEGLLVITRWLQEDPSEWLRTFALAVTALEEESFDPGEQIVALRGYNTGTLLVKKSAFNSEEMRIIREYSEDKAFDLVFCPGLNASEINQNNILPEPVYYQTFQDLLTTNPRKDFYKAFPYEVDPPTDDHPFFGHYFKWSQIDDIIKLIGITWQPFGGAGYLVVLVIFSLAVTLAGLLILLPVMFTKGWKKIINQRWDLMYFASIGFAYLLVEIPLIQRFILYLDQPAYAFSVVLFGVLFFSGLGSRFGSEKISSKKGLIILIGFLVGYVLLLPGILYATLGLPMAARLAVSVLLIAPLGFLMGIPFPTGLARLRERHKGNSEEQWLVGWIWAVNGACSVIASILASLLSLTFGLRATLIIGAGFYMLAWLTAVIKTKEKKSLITG